MLEHLNKQILIFWEELTQNFGSELPELDLQLLELGEKYRELLFLHLVFKFVDFRILLRDVIEQI